MANTKRIDFDGRALGSFVALLSWENTTWIGWRLYQVIAGDGRANDAASNDDLVPDLLDAEPVAKGVVTWNGECHFMVDAMVSSEHEMATALHVLRCVYAECIAVRSETSQ